MMDDSDSAGPLTPYPRVLVVLVNYRTSRLTIDCLQSLWAEVSAWSGCRVVVVDNASGDESVAEIRSAIQARKWNSRVSLLPLQHNGGFASGNNAAIRWSRMKGEKPKYVMLLNPDTLVTPGALRALVTFMEANPRIGIAGSRLQDRTGAVQCSAYRVPSVLGELLSGARLGPLSRLFPNCLVPIPAQDKSHPCDWVSGAAMLVRREVFDAVGLFDEEFFLYYEEVDFCRRACRAGWPVWHVPASRIIHLEGGATGIGDGRRRPAYWFDSRRRYFLNNHGLGYAAGADLMRIAGLVLWRMHRWLRNKPEVDPPHLLGDLVRHSVFVKGTR